LKVALAASAAISLVLLGCAENPTTAPSNDPLLAHAAVSFSKSAPPPKGGIGAQIANTNLAIDSLGMLFGVEPQPVLSKNGIPQQLAAQSVQLALTMAAAGQQVDDMNAKIAAGTATEVEISALIARLELAGHLVYRVQGLLLLEGAVKIGDMFAMQMMMNSLSQMSEMSTAVVDALNQALIDMGRPPKGP